MDKKSKYFTASDCIHLHACRRVTAIANKALKGKGSQKLVRGCNKQCVCYRSVSEVIDDLSDAIGMIDRANDEVSSYADVFPTTDPPRYIQGDLYAASRNVECVLNFVENIHANRQNS